MVCTIFIQANDYGIAVDEPLQNGYGHSVLAWYASLGKNQGFLHIRTDLYMPQHGPFFEVVVALAQQLFGNEWTTRAIVTGLAGVVGIVAVMLCGYVLGGEWLAFVAGLLLWGYPRYFGSMWNNSKDIPFAAAMALVLWAVLLLVTQWQARRRLVRNSLLVGFFLGMAISIRVTALLWFFILVALPACWWLIHLNHARISKQVGTTLRKQALSALLIGGACFVTMLVLWPYFFLNPLAHLYESVMVMQHYPWNGPVTFQGRVYQANQLPWDYVLVWLGIGSPLFIVLFALLGLLLWAGQAIHSRRIDAPLAVLALALLISVGVMTVSHPTLYDGPRQFFFLVPMMILLAACSIYSFCHLLWRRSHLIARLLVVLVIIATGINYGLILKTMSDLHPYEYTYFNALVGGVGGANGNYDIDYWRICTKPASQWLSAHYRSLTNNPHPTITSLPFPFQAIYNLPSTFVWDDANPDFYIASMHDQFDQRFPNYTIVHTERIDGQVPVCVVKMRPGVNKQTVFKVNPLGSTFRSIPWMVWYSIFPCQLGESSAGVQRAAELSPDWMEGLSLLLMLHATHRPQTKSIANIRKQPVEIAR